VPAQDKVRMRGTSNGVITRGMRCIIALTSSMFVAIYEKELFLGLFENTTCKSGY
jgi:hypothetical protein